MNGSTGAELNLEKLQLIATAKASSTAKIRWLELFNSSIATREARCLPPKPCNEQRLTHWLGRACFWAAVSHISPLHCNAMLYFCFDPIVNFCLLNLITYAWSIFQLSEEASTSLDDILRSDRPPINMNVSTEPMGLETYVEDCRMKLFDHAFLSYFKGTDAFTKSTDFKDFKGSDLVVRRVLYR